MENHLRIQRPRKEEGLKEGAKAVLGMFVVDKKTQPCRKLKWNYQLDEYIVRTAF